MDYENIIARLRRYADIHDRPPYGRMIEDEEVLEREAADAIEGLMKQVKALQNSCRIETPLGALIARSSGGEPDYPGIYVDIRRPDADQDLLLALIEYTKDEADFPEGERHIITRVYGDAMEDEYTERVVHSGIDDYFKAE